MLTLLLTSAPRVLSNKFVIAIFVYIFFVIFLWRGVGWRSVLIFGYVFCLSLYKLRILSWLYFFVVFLFVFLFLRVYVLPKKMGRIFFFWFVFFGVESVVFFSPQERVVPSSFFFLWCVRCPSLSPRVLSKKIG